MGSMQRIIVGFLLAFLCSPIPSTCSPTLGFNSLGAFGIVPRAETVKYCYMPNGQPIPLGSGMYMQTCKPGPSGEAMCCNTKAGEKCGKDGVCMQDNVEKNKWGATKLRGGCTDKTWKAPECLQVCKENNDQLNPPGTPPTWQEPLIVCPDGLMCCGVTGNEQTDSCCREHKGFKVELDDDGYPQLRNYTDLEQNGSLPPPSETTAAIAPTGTSTTAETKEQQEGNNRGGDNKLSKGTIALIVVVSSLSLCLSGCVAWLLHRRWKSYRERRQREKEYAIFSREPELDGNCISEMGSESTLGSRACTVVIAELPGSEVRSGEEHEMWTPGADTIMSRIGGSSGSSERSGSTSDVSSASRDGAVSSNSARSRDDIVSQEIDTVSRDFAAEMDAKFDTAPGPTDQNARDGVTR